VRLTASRRYTDGCCVLCGGFAAECHVGVSDVEWMTAHLTSKASGAAGAGCSPAVVSQNGLLCSVANASCVAFTADIGG